MRGPTENQHEELSVFNARKRLPTVCKLKRRRSIQFILSHLLRYTLALFLRVTGK